MVKGNRSSKNVTEGVVRKGGVGENTPKREVNKNIGKRGQTVITDKTKK